MGSDGWTAMRAAWKSALYGVNGFYRRELPADHFRTSTHVSGDFAAAVLDIAREHDMATVVDVGAGAGELLDAIRARDRDLRLVGIEMRPRPTTLAPGIDWQTVGGSRPELDAGREPTLLIANELLDNVPCDVVELAEDGLRTVEVHRASGRERLGAPADPATAAWLTRWWPLSPGRRAVVGLARETMWARVCSSIADGVCIAVDYGHTLGGRPHTESPVSFRKGRCVPAQFDGTHDITAHVAVDAVAAAVDGVLERQRDVLESRLPSLDRPPIDEARTDPVGYLRRLSAGGDRRELTASPGLGDFWWITSRCRSLATADAQTETAVAS